MKRLGVALILVVSLVACTEAPGVVLEYTQGASSFFSVEQAYFSNDNYTSMYTNKGAATYTDNNGVEHQGSVFMNEDGDKVFVEDGQSTSSFTGITISGTVETVQGKPCPEEDGDEGGEPSV